MTPEWFHQYNHHIGSVDLSEFTSLKIQEDQTVERFCSGVLYSMRFLSTNLTLLVPCCIISFWSVVGGLVGDLRVPCTSRRVLSVQIPLQLPWCIMWITRLWSFHLISNHCKVCAANIATLVCVWSIVSDAMPSLFLHSCLNFSMAPFMEPTISMRSNFGLKHTFTC